VPHDVVYYVSEVGDPPDGDRLDGPQQEVQVSSGEDHQPVDGRILERDEHYPIQYPKANPMVPKTTAMTVGTTIK
jgi:hypothetical protein